VGGLHGLARFVTIVEVLSGIVKSCVTSFGAFAGGALWDTWGGFEPPVATAGAETRLTDEPEPATSSGMDFAMTQVTHLYCLFTTSRSIFRADDGMV